MDPKLVERAEFAASLMKDNPREGYKYSPRCKICSAISKKTGKNIRPEVDAAVMNTQKARAGLKVFEEHGLANAVTVRQIQLHIKDHSPFVRLGVNAMQVRSEVNTALAEHVAAQDALQEIVNVGMEKVRNGEMPVTEKLFSTALKEANKNHQVSKFEEIAKELDRKLFNRKTIKPEVKEMLEAEVIEGEAESA